MPSPESAGEGGETNDHTVLGASAVWEIELAAPARVGYRTDGRF